MSNRKLLLALLSLWTLSVVSGPLFLYSLMGDEVVVSLNTGEEESGETFSVDELEEKLLARPYPLLAMEPNAVADAPRMARGLVDFGLEYEIRLPPPEWGAQSRS